MKRILFSILATIVVGFSHIVSASAQVVALPPALQGMQVERGALMSFPSQDGSIAVIAVRVLLGDGGYQEFFDETHWARTKTLGLLPASYDEDGKGLGATEVPRKEPSLALMKYTAFFCALNAQEHGFNCASPEPKKTTKEPYWIPLGVVATRDVEQAIAGLITPSAQAVAPAPVQAVTPPPTTPVVAQSPERPRERELIPEPPIVRHEVPPPLPPRASASPPIAQTGYGIVWDDSPPRHERQGQTSVWDDSPPPPPLTIPRVTRDR